MSSVCPKQSLAELKRLHDKDATFVGGVDHLHALRTGTPQDVADEVKRRIDELAAGGGYILGPGQAFTRMMPQENIIAMYETALDYGSH